MLESIKCSTSGAYYLRGQWVPADVQAIALRKRLPVVRDGSYQVYERNSDALYVYARETKEQKLLVVCSFTDRPVRFCPPYPFSLDDMKLLLCNYPDAGSGASFVTRPYEARVYLYE